MRCDGELAEVDAAGAGCTREKSFAVQVRSRALRWKALGRCDGEGHAATWFWGSELRAGWWLGSGSLVERCMLLEAPPAAVAAFNSYVATVEARLAQGRTALERICWLGDAGQSEGAGSTAAGRVDDRGIDTGAAELPGAMLHDWRGTAFAPGAKAADFERLMRDFDGYPQHVCAAGAAGEGAGAAGRSLSGDDAGAAEARDHGGDGYGVRRDVWAAGCAARVQHFAQHADRGDRRAGNGERARAGCRARSTAFCGG